MFDKGGCVSSTTILTMLVLLNTALFVLYKNIREEYEREMQTKKQNKNVLVGVGLDTIQCDIPTEYELMENEHVFVSPKTGIEIADMKNKM